jgi:hypothetical protein
LQAARGASAATPSPGAAGTSFADDLGSVGAGLTRPGVGTLPWLLVIFIGAALIAMLFLDALGLGPRHDYLRRRSGRPWWLP